MSNQLKLFKIGIVLVHVDHLLSLDNLKFSSLNDNNNLDFTNMTAYTFNRPLNKTYFNVSNVNAFITTF